MSIEVFRLSSAEWRFQGPDVIGDSRVKNRTSCRRFSFAGSVGKEVVALIRSLRKVANVVVSSSREKTVAVIFSRSCKNEGNSAVDSIVRFCRCRQLSISKSFGITSPFTSTFQFHRSTNTRHLAKRVQRYRSLRAKAVLETPGSALEKVDR